VLFLSAKSFFEPGKPIRGGIPVIFPWFGPREGDASMMHGFVRTRAWEVESVRQSDDGAVQIILSTRSTNETHDLWPHDFAARLTVTVGRKLEMALEIANPTSQAFTFEDALHTYYAVSDIRQVSLHGLKGASYLDKNQGMARVTEKQEIIQPAGAMDRVYIDTVSRCTIADKLWNRRIMIEKEQSRSTVVWNPWQENMAKFADLAADEWTRFFCVETCNARDNKVTLPPGASHTMRLSISSERLT
jgi:glucose-6-phosphate 1-epimerase